MNKSRFIYNSTNKITAIYNPPYHKGVDLIANESGLPKYITAHSDGIIHFRQDFPYNDPNTDKAWGNCLIVRHSDNSGFNVAHLDEMYVKEGDRVVKGQKIGTMGNTGKSFGIHVHIEYYENVFNLSNRSDPTPYINADLPQLNPPTSEIGINYTVQSGDTLTSIAKVFNVTVDYLMEINPQITNKNLIYVGQKIAISINENKIYTVRAGDTLSKIAIDNNTTVNSLLLKNPNIENKNVIYIGQVIKL